MLLNSLTEPSYFPDPTQSTTLQLGLRGLAPSDWLVTDQDFPQFLAHKRLMKSTHPSQIYQSIPSSQQAQYEFSQRLDSHLKTYHGEHYRHAYALIAENEKSDMRGKPLEKLWESSLWIQEDICLMEEIRGEYILTAASLCSPTNWKLEEKIGQPLDFIHAPVPGYETQLADRVNRLIGSIQSNKSLARYNWSIQNNSELCWRDDVVTEDDGYHWRVERQTLMRLPETGAVVFGIRIFIHSFETMSKYGEFESMLNAILQRLSKDTLRYKSLNKYLMSLS